MLFSSITFLYYFLPVTLIIYYIVPAKRKNLILFLASLIFYFWGEPKYSVLLLVSVGIGYLGGRCIEWISGKQHTAAGEALSKENEKFAKKRKQIVLAGFITLTLGILGVFKYADFFIKNVNAITGAGHPLLQLALPLGISFYTFQIISYYVDVYRGDVQAEHNFVDFAAYVTMFPQLIAGPIVRFSSIQKELKQRESTCEKISDGAGRFVCGLCKKVLIADNLGILVSYLEKVKEGYWILAVAYMLQLYYDFSGYSDMAIGLGKMLGFTFPENFDHPFISKSITEFWRRWHMTLGGWLRDYVYIPLGGSRVSVPRWCFHMFVVWFLSGLWHGAGWNFVLWGLYFGVLLTVEKLITKFYRTHISGKLSEKFYAENPVENLDRKFDSANLNRKEECRLKKIITDMCSHLYVLFVVMVSFIIFRVENLPDIGVQILALFQNPGAVSAGVAYEIRSYSILLLMSCVGATPVLQVGWDKLKGTAFGERFGWLLQTVLIVAGLLLSTAYLIGSSAHPFLYFRF